MLNQDYRPTGTLAVEIAVATAETNDVVSSIRIYVRSRSVIASPTTFITANDLTHEVISRAGLTETATISNYTLTRTDTYDDSYVYVLDADVA